MVALSLQQILLRIKENNATWFMQCSFAPHARSQYIEHFGEAPIGHKHQQDRHIQQVF